MTRQKRNFLAAWAILAMTAGCAKKTLVQQEPAVTPTAKETAPKQEEGDDVELALRGKNFTATKDLGVIFYDYDQSDMRADMREIAMKNAEFLKLHPGLEVRIDGHCDERGTAEYNLALGQRRAAALRAYYRSLGVPGERMATQSWGEEKPLCAEETESCHANNRRGETLVRSNAPTKGSSAATGNTNHQPSDKPK
ncbi:MAG: OmpA family protein [Elusimicrobia bacterium]|nr:OmpA family protein [Elusimicrobiota bacterium]